MAGTWNVLVVDDEPDVFDVTHLALKTRQWRKVKFKLAAANSGPNAREVLAAHDPAFFHVAIIDVVMESETAGLDLCKWIRANYPSSLRIILRTGQPGMAPEEHVLNEYDIDYYLAKSEATPEKLFTVIRACLRSSQDISTLVAFGTQLKSFTKALQTVTALEDLLMFMKQGLSFLELKHACAISFGYDLDKASGDAILTGTNAIKADLAMVMRGMAQAHKTPVTNEPIAGPSLGLASNSVVFPFFAGIEQAGDGKAEAVIPAKGAMYAEVQPDYASTKLVSDLHADASLFIENWKIAFGAIRLQQRLARERMLREEMYHERLQSLSTLVSGVAHEMNTPLGVANTAASMIGRLVGDLLEEGKAPEEKKEAGDDMLNCCNLLQKNLTRTNALISSFKQLSSSQLSDSRAKCNLADLITDIIRTIERQLEKRQIAITFEQEDGIDDAWDGFPGHLTQVLMSLFNNAKEFAYDGQTAGKIDVRLAKKTLDNAEWLQIEFQDYGKGVSAEIMPHLFEPFVTSARGIGKTGLGLSITHNIVNNLLGGRITCVSKPGEGATFTLLVPKAVPEQKRPDLALAMGGNAA